MSKNYKDMTAGIDKCKYIKCAIYVEIGTI